MKLNLIPVLVAGLLSAAPAFSASTTIDFEAPPSFASIADFYSSVGVSFGLDALAIQNDTLGPYFSNAPSPVGVMTAVGTDAALNFAAGFNTGAMFSYSSTAVSTVGVYSGLNGTGDLLGSFQLSNNAQSGCSDSPFCNWSQATLAFSGTAKSITFGDAANVAGFDNVTIGAVPEPTEALMLALGLGVLAQVVRRTRREQASA
jgi:hypothetical protein